MKVTLSSSSCTELKTDLLVIAAGADWRSGETARLDLLLAGRLIPEIRHQGFKGAEGEAALFQTHGAPPARYVLIVGIGNGTGPQPWYRLADTIVQRARDCKASSTVLSVAHGELAPPIVKVIVEGALLSDYTFTRLKSSTADHASGLRHLTLAGVAGAASRAAVVHAQTVAAATCYARDIINLPAAIVTPTYLGNEAKRIARAQRLRVRVLGPAAIKRAGMGALLGVAQASAQPPRFIELMYQPTAADRRSTLRVALAGKGITFDSGGLSIKPADAMASQKRDMAGGAAVLAVMSAVRDLAIPVEVRAYIPATENMPGGRAIKPGDVVRAFNGKTIEVLNTDAEGRLVLADALSYAAAAKPDVLIDLATLTGAVRTALGSRYAAILGTNSSLVQTLVGAARDCGEHLWELPLAAEYRADIDSAVADLKNIADGGAGTIIGGLFLREFVGAVPWAHIDFSSTVMADKPFACHPRGATGFGVRTLLRYLGSLVKGGSSPDTMK